MRARAWIPAPPAKSSRFCNAVDDVGTEKQARYAYCTKPAHHWEKDDAIHFDDKRKHSWTETIFWDEFERGRTARAGAVKAAKKVNLCKKCGKQVRTDGGPDSCVCKATGRGAKQAKMFMADRERIEKEIMAADLDEDVAEFWVRYDANELRIEREAIQEFG